MEIRTFQTPFGEIWLHGQAQAFASDRPVLLCIAGAFANLDRFTKIQDYVPEAAVMIGHVPGNHCPTLVNASIGVYAAAYGSVVSELSRPTVVMGASVGGLVALGMKGENIRAVMALDPPLTTAALWPLHRLWPPTPGRDLETAGFLHGVFGIGEASVEARDYLSVLDGRTIPAVCMIGEIPLMPERDLEDLPSLVDDIAKAALERSLNVESIVVSGTGHDIPQQAPAVVVDRLRRLIRSHTPMRSPALSRHP